MKLVNAIIILLAAFECCGASEELESSVDRNVPVGRQLPPIFTVDNFLMGVLSLFGYFQVLFYLTSQCSSATSCTKTSVTRSTVTATSTQPVASTLVATETLTLLQAKAAPSTRIIVAYSTRDAIFTDMKTSTQTFFGLKVRMSVQVNTVTRSSTKTIRFTKTSTTIATSERIDATPVIDSTKTSPAVRQTAVQHVPSETFDQMMETIEDSFTSAENAIEEDWPEEGDSFQDGDDFSVQSSQYVGGFKITEGMFYDPVLVG